MTSSITSKDLEDFWIRVYLGSSSDLISMAIDRAYRDFSRTQHGIKENKTEERYNILKAELRKYIAELLASKFDSQRSFDLWHESKCNELLSCYRTKVGYKRITYGQAQKWINMSLKYLYALGEDRIPNISNNYKFFHIPIDRIILEELGMSLKCAWSRIENYDDYLNFQKAVRLKFAGEIPMDVEFKLFNQLK